MMSKYFLVLFLALILPPCFFAVQAHAATITWTAAAASSWNVSSSWSTGAVPKSTDIARFSASSTKNATVNMNVNVTGIQITSGYTGVITQSGGQAITIGASGYSQASGTFTGSGTTGDIAVNGPYSLTGGTFTSTKGTLTIGSTTATFAPAFQNNSGTVLFATSTVINGSSTFYNLIFSDNNQQSLTTFAYTVATGTVLTVQHTLGLTQSEGQTYYYGGGEIDAKGDIVGGDQTDYSSSFTATGTVSFVINGSGTQNLGTSSVDFYWTILPDLTINKPSGAVNLAGDILLYGNWTNNNGPAAVSAGTSTVFFMPPSATITGSTTFNNLWLGGNGASGNPMDASLAVTTGTVVTVNSSTVMGQVGYGLYLQGGGEIDAKGDVMTADGEDEEFLNGYPTSTFNFVLNGTGTQIVSNAENLHADEDYNTIFQLWLPSLTINKPSGTVNFINNIAISGNWTNYNGSSVMNPGTSTIFLTGLNPTITGSSTFNALVFGMSQLSNNVGLTIATGTVLAVQSSTVLYPNYEDIVDLLGGGEIDAAGDVLLGLGGDLTDATLTVKLILNGTSTQTINDLGYSYYNSTPGDAVPFALPNLVINKPSGVVLASANYLYISSGNSLTVTKGELRLSGAQVFNDFGGLTVSSGGMLSDSPTAPSTLGFPPAVTNNGTIFFSGDGIACTVPAPNNVIIQPADGSTPSVWSGSGNNVMRYVAASGQHASAGSPIKDYNGTDGGGNLNWSFPTALRTQLIQSAFLDGGSGTTQLTLPAFGIWPEAGDLILVAVSAANQSIAAPTDNASNTYTLVASQAWDSLPNRALSLYYAKGTNNTSSLVITVNGTGGSSGQLLSGAAFEYAGMAPSSTFDNYSANQDTSGGATSLTSFSVVGLSTIELYFGTMSLSASTTASSGSGWTARAGEANNSTRQSLYTEEMGTTSIAPFAATWTAATSTSYAAILGVFRAPFSQGYAATGTLDSAPFDTGVLAGAQLNSFTWQGNQSHGTAVKFQFAVSNSAGGPWAFQGPDGTANTYFSGNPGASISLLPMASGYRYFEYRVTLFANGSGAYTPTVTGVSVNWSP